MLPLKVTSPVTACMARVSVVMLLNPMKIFGFDRMVSQSKSASTPWATCPPWEASTAPMPGSANIRLMSEARCAGRPAM